MRKIDAYEVLVFLMKCERIGMVLRSELGNCAFCYDYEVIWNLYGSLIVA
jgi:hypothetical protein